MGYANFEELKRCEAERQRLLDRAEKITNTAKAEDRDITADEQEAIDGLLVAANVVSRGSVKPGNMALATAYGSPEARAFASSEFGRRPKGPSMFGIDARTGQTIPMFVSGESMREYHVAQNPDIAGYRLGEDIVGAITSQRNKSTEIRAAMGGGTNSGGGFAVPSPLYSGIADLSRNKAVVFRGGAPTFEMTSDTLTIATIESDPPMTVKGENAAWTASDFELGSRMLTARTIGCVVDLSRELAQDAPNIVQVIEEKLAMSLAVEIDRLALVGTNPWGLTGMSGTQTIAIGGAIDYGDLLDAIEDIEQVNGSPNAYILSAANKTVLAKLLVNSEANHYAVAPPDVSALMRLQTESIGDGTMIVGDFTKLIVGLRQDAFVEVTTTGGERFNRHQVGVKVSWRGDFAAMYPDHFNILTGIS